MITTKEVPNGRGCGKRSTESPYICCGLAVNGAPIEDFIIDPAIPWPGEFQRGVKILPRNSKDFNSVNDLVIFVGRGFYPSPWDFVEEVKRFGVSRKVPKNLPFEQLTPGESRMIFVHSKVIPTFDYEANRDRPYYGCRHFFTDGNYDKEKWEKSVSGWHSPEKPCTHALRDLAFFSHGDISPTDSKCTYLVNMPSFTYEAKYPTRPYSKYDTTWNVGIFMALPITHIEYCQKADVKSRENATTAGFETVVLEY